jgi:hypothetical protein
MRVVDNTGAEQLVHFYGNSAEPMLFLSAIGGWFEAHPDATLEKLAGYKIDSTTYARENFAVLLTVRRAV